jgi:hypothetical protein
MFLVAKALMSRLAGQASGSGRQQIGIDGCYVMKYVLIQPLAKAPLYNNSPHYHY